MAEQFAPDYGTDISCTTDLDPFFRMVSGTEMMAQAAVRRLMCRKGSLLSDPLYGIDVRDFLNSRVDAVALRQKIPALIIGELTRDERIDTVVVVATYNQNTKVLNLDIKCTGATGPFSLVLSVAAGEVTAEILAP